MQIISHRGYWLDATEKNTVAAFHRSFSMGYGTETDIRDCAGKLMISHDMPNGTELTFDEMLEIYLRYDQRPCLALNVKADGLQTAVAESLQQHGIENYFMFDMSLPDTLGYLRNGLTTFLRASEYETPGVLLEQAQGVWLDGFQRLNIDAGQLQQWLSAGKKVCIVSPELHRRDVNDEWSELRNLPGELLKSDHLILCTDIPEQAERHFRFD